MIVFAYINNCTQWNFSITMTQKKIHTNTHKNDKNKKILCLSWEINNITGKIQENEKALIEKESHTHNAKENTYSNMFVAILFISLCSGWNSFL